MDRRREKRPLPPDGHLEEEEEKAVQEGGGGGDRRVDFSLACADEDTLAMVSALSRVISSRAGEEGGETPAATGSQPAAESFCGVQEAGPPPRLAQDDEGLCLLI